MIENLKSALTGVSILGLALGGGVATKVLDIAFMAYRRRAADIGKQTEVIVHDEANKRHELVVEEQAFRDDLRNQVNDLKLEVKDLRAHIRVLTGEVLEWRDKYYQSVASNLELNTKYVVLQTDYVQLKAAHVELDNKYQQLQKQFDVLLVEIREVRKRANV